MKITPQMIDDLLSALKAWDAAQPVVSVTEYEPCDGTDGDMEGYDADGYYIGLVHRLAELEIKSAVDTGSLPPCATEGVTDSDKLPRKSVVEPVREWLHGGNPNDYCMRRDKPVYTPPAKIPDPCRSCGQEEWRDGKVRLRLKDTKQIIR